MTKIEELFIDRLMLLVGPLMMNVLLAPPFLLLSILHLLLLLPFLFSLILIPIWTLLHGSSRPCFFITFSSVFPPLLLLLLLLLISITTWVLRHSFSLCVQYFFLLNRNFFFLFFLFILHLSIFSFSRI